MYYVRPPTRKRGCLFWILLLMGTLFGCCIFSLVLYVVLPPPPVTVLVVGVDARPGEGNLTRTDSIMLVGFQPRGLRASALSIPRDLMIMTDDYGLQHINAIHVLGEMEDAGQGPQLLQESIALSFGINTPDRYVRLNFEAFEELIDAVGGVTIDIDRAVIDYAYPTDDFGTMTVQFDVGREHMNGERALQYARTRHSDDDYFRAGRQQQVLSALSRKLLNPLYLPAVTSVLIRHVDTDLSPFDLLVIAPTMLLNGGDFDRLVIDREYIRPAQGGAVPDYGKLAPWMQGRFE